MNSNQWIKTFCIVSFDEDFGQKLDWQYPEIFTEEQQQAIAFLAFPDSNSMDKIGDHSYVFRIKDQNYYGFVYFRQQKDINNKRGYNQSSIVLITQNPFISLFRQIINIIAPAYFDGGREILTNSWEEINSWGVINQGETREFFILGSSVTYSIPSEYELNSLQACGSNLSANLDVINQGYPGQLQDINIYQIFGSQNIKKYIWRLWEIVVLGEPLLILTNYPETCSLMVLGLVSLLSPLKYEGNFHPYFTIFDNEFRDIQQNMESQNQSAVILGVTNPFFLKALNTCKNIFEFEENGEIILKSKISKHKSLFHPINQIVSEFLQNESNEASAINNSIIRRHFRELNQALIDPFCQYFSLNLQKLRESPYIENPTFKNFRDSEFLREIGSSDSNAVPLFKFISKQNGVKFYEKFIKTSTFIHWFAEQRQKANASVHILVQNAIHNYDLEKVLPSLEHEQCLIIYSKIETRIKYEETIENNEDIVKKLKDQLEILARALLKFDQEYVFI